MLFLAVTLGFFVENQREHYIEKQRAHEFAKSLVSDLQSDVNNLGELISVYDSAVKNLTMFIGLVDGGQPEKVSGGAFYFYGDVANMNYRMAFFTATIEQLKSSGSLRYFPITLRKKISKYDQYVQEYNLRQSNEPIYNIETRKYYEKIFDHQILERLKSIHHPDSVPVFRSINFPLLTNDKILLKEFANNCYGRKEAWESRVKFMLVPIKKIAEDLIVSLNDEYHLE